MRYNLYFCHCRTTSWKLIHEDIDLFPIGKSLQHGIFIYDNHQTSSDTVDLIYTYGTFGHRTLRKATNRVVRVPLRIFRTNFQKLDSTWNVDINSIKKGD